MSADVFDSLLDAIDFIKDTIEDLEGAFQRLCEVAQRTLRERLQYLRDPTKVMRAIEVLPQLVSEVKRCQRAMLVPTLRRQIRKQAYLGRPRHYLPEQMVELRELLRRR